MNRRDFFRRAASVSTIAAVGGLDSTDGYVPTGYLAAGGPGSDRVDFITLNGARVEHVLEFNDVDGWLRHYVDAPGRAAGMPDVAYRTGIVRVKWLPERIAELSA